MSHFHEADRAESKDPLLVVGLGHPLRGDDAAGLELVRRVRHQRHLPCRLLDSTQGGFDVLEVLDEASVVLFVDAVVSGARPGSMHLVSLPCPGIQPRNFGVSSHGLGLLEALQLRRVLHHPQPPVFLLGIEIDKAEAGTALSAPVAECIDRIALAFRGLIAPLCQVDSHAQHTHRQAVGWK